MRTLEQITTELRDRQAAARHYDGSLNERGEGFNPHTDAIRRLERDLDRVQEATASERLAAILQAEDAAWTREVTTLRRAAWNTWVKAQGKRLDGSKVAAQVKHQGWTLEALKRQVARHGL
jgi:hypothetical protein